MVFDTSFHFAFRFETLLVGYVLIEAKDVVLCDII